MLRLLIFGVIASFPATLAENCDIHGILIYEDMNCTAIYKGENACPIRYSCDFGKDQSCFFRNRYFGVGEQVPEYLLQGMCIRNCTCNENFMFECETITCQLNVADPNCYYPYDLKQCCALEQEYCPETENTCSYGDKLYREKEVFNRNDDCQKCICRSDGTYICERRSCASQITNGAQIQRRCAPLYETVDVSGSASLCCPYQWVCPEDMGLEEGTGDTEIQDACVFGSTIYQVGEYIVNNKTLTTCSCLVPPLMTCITY